MNIVSSNCCSGYFYRILMNKAENPFIWSFHKYKDFKELYTKYDTIKFDNANFTITENKTIKCEVDNTFTQNYNHYFYDDKCNTPLVKNNCIFYKDILDYCKNKYYTRLARMKEPPIFLIQWLRQDGFTKEALNEFLTLEHKYKIVIFTDEMPSSLSNDKIVKIINHPDVGTFEKSNPMSFLTIYKNEILEFMR